MFYATLGAWKERRGGRAVLAAWAAVVLGFSIKAAVGSISRRRHMEPPRKQSPSAKAKSVLKRAIGVGFGSAAPKVYTLLLSTAICLRMFSSIKLSRQIGVLGSRLAKRDWKGVHAAQLDFAKWAAPAAAATALVTFAQARLSLAVRANLQKAVEDAYSKSASSVGASRDVEQADARATADVESLSDALSGLYVSVFKPTTEVITLSVSLSSMMGFGNLLKCYTSFAALGLWSRWVSPSFSSARSGVADAEARLRDGWVRVVAKASEIEALRGRPREVEDLQRRGAALRRSVSRHTLLSSMSNGLDTYVVRHLGTLAAFTAMMPAVYDGAMEDGASIDPTEYFLTALHLLVNVGLACRELVQAFRRLSTSRALSERVLDLVDALEAQPAEAEAATSNGFALTGVTVATGGNGDALLSDVTLNLMPGTAVLLRGPNGCGKSSFLKVLAGVWQPTAGTIARPPVDDFLYLPQLPYLAPYATLREQLSYPLAPAGFSQAAVEDAVTFAGLGDVQTACGGLDAPCEAVWAGLSLGEQQRVSLARAVLRKTQFALLDESTSAVPRPFEQAVFRRLQADGVTVITVSHNPAVDAFHKVLLGVEDGSLTSTTL